MNVEVNNESGVEIDAHGLMRLSRFVMSSLKLHPECELSIKLVDEDTMARYNVEFLDLPDGQVAMRNSRHPDGPALIFTQDEMSDLIDRLKSGTLDDLVRPSGPGTLRC